MCAITPLVLYRKVYYNLQLISHHISLLHVLKLMQGKKLRASGSLWKFRNDVFEERTAAKSPVFIYYSCRPPAEVQNARQRENFVKICLYWSTLRQSKCQADGTYFSRKSVPTKLSAAELNGSQSWIPTTTRALSFIATIFLPLVWAFYK